jgi:hypothetical protein
MADSRVVRTRGQTCAEFSMGLQTSISRYPHEVASWMQTSCPWTAFEPRLVVASAAIAPEYR